jgi:hypothetical protein
MEAATRRPLKAEGASGSSALHSKSSSVSSILPLVIRAGLN